MKKKIVFCVFCLVVLIISVYPIYPIQAAGDSAISLEENVFLPNSDVELIALTEKGKVYAVVNRNNGEWKLYRSEDQGKSWLMAFWGLPEREKFVALKASGENVALATRTQVYISRDGIRFDCINGPLGLAQRGEEIASLAILSGNPPSILVGIRNPTVGRFAEEGVFFWSENQWKAQGMREAWQNKGYASDVTSVAFFAGNILAVATGDPDGAGPRAEGTYINIAPIGQKGPFLGVNWNWIDGWPIEISQMPGQSPKERDVISSKLALSEMAQEGKIYTIVTTRGLVNDNVHLIKLTGSFTPLGGARKLEIPKPSATSLDSIDYRDSSGTLVVGVTTGDRGAMIYSLHTGAEERYPLDWGTMRMAATDTFSCQVGISTDGTVFAGTSGLASCFARGEKSSLIPISLIDVSVGAGINQVVPSANFLEDKTLFLNYGDRNVFRVVLGESPIPERIERIFYTATRFEPSRVRMESDLSQNIFIYEVGTTRFWMSQNVGLSFMARQSDVVVSDVRMVGNDIWIAGKDGMLYLQSSITGVTQKRVSSGMTWLGGIKPGGPEGKILAIGGSKENYLDTISLVSEQYKLLPPLPVPVLYPSWPVTSSLPVVYSKQDSAIYYGATNRKLYRLSLSEGNWEEIAFNLPITDLLVSSQGLYVLSPPRIYFASFPLSKTPQWKILEGVPAGWTGWKLVETAGGDLLVLWDSWNFVTYTPKISGEKPQVQTTPESAKPAPTPTAPTSTQKPPPTPTPIPAKFVPSALSVTPAEVGIDKKVTISVLVTNTGGLSGSHKVTCKVDDVEVATQDVTLDVGDKQQVIFSTTKGVAGSHLVTVDGLVGSFKVRVTPTLVPKPSQPTSLLIVISCVSVLLAIIVVILVVVIRRRRA